MTAVGLKYCAVALLVLPLIQCGPYPKPQRFGDISEKTKFITVQLPRGANGRVGSSVPFVAPPGCSPTIKSIAENYCVNGTYSAGSTMDLAMTLNVFDVTIPTRTVTLGIQTNLNEGNATTVTAMTGGCATILKQTIVIFLLDGEITACTSGGGKGKYDPALPGYVSAIDLSGQLKFTSGKKNITDYNYSLPGYVHAGNRFDMGMAASVYNSSGDPKGIGVNSTFFITMNNTAGSLFDWRIFVGLSTDSWAYPLPAVHVNTAIVDTVIHLKV
ncbi:hypothetical protein FOZ62_007506 [Perkinsus olseni]|uniref:Uncharacterized protein n=1 Tax=Perkinsus olseni TaxID=32597 RepID=A0A7J6U0K2_PEROL|nr:hypothetical protein FOZ62_007506 [Perkinsus olseni]